MERVKVSQKVFLTGYKIESIIILVQNMYRKYFKAAGPRYYENKSGDAGSLKIKINLLRFRMKFAITNLYILRNNSKEYLLPSWEWWFETGSHFIVGKRILFPELGHLELELGYCNFLSYLTVPFSDTFQKVLLK